MNGHGRRVDVEAESARPTLVKGDQVHMEMDGEVTHWVVTDVDEEGGGTLRRADSHTG